ncbi:MAG: RecQ family ATP-dependent DNA helicase [Planctomycetes bacterium]|nr:RecQ family ATP-dependent DNA helicase [Planctomycetota bacterium]
MTFTAHGLGLDLELNDKELLELGACRGAAEFRHGPGRWWQALDEFAAGAEFWFGHNVLWFDRPWLQQHAPGLALHRLPVVDTLALSAIAFAEHPYHALLKDYKLVRSQRNDPVADARLSAQLLDEAQDRLRQLAAAQPVFLAVLHALAVRAFTTIDAQAGAGMARCFAGVVPASQDLDRDLRAVLADRVCTTALDQLLPIASLLPERLRALLFVVSWLRVAAGPGSMSPSVLMPWVRRQHPEAVALCEALRSRACTAPECNWCRAMHDPRALLRRWFGHDDFRALPALEDGRSAQAAIVAAGQRQEPLLALLPTGGGKSLCFQLPALARYVQRGSLTVVISPLQSLMHDQVENFAHKTGSPCAVALSGRLTPPERRAALEAMGSGAAGIVYVAPEQLRNRSFRRTLMLREIGAFVFDEAHCLSKWGHDFRPDYLYAARFVKEFHHEQGTAPAPVVCVTATAKPEVRDEIRQHFRTELGQELVVFDGHAPRQNLLLQVETCSMADKIPRLRELVGEQLQRDRRGSVLVYTATRRHAEHAAAMLGAVGIPTDAFHAGLDLARRKQVQEQFLRGQLRVVCATNAFGMGIDKPDIRLVVHYEIPGSLEAYVQEVGRAGRDGAEARAVLLHTEDDVETQFRLAAASRLDRRDVSAVLRRVRNLARHRAADGVHETYCTTGEILRTDGPAEVVGGNERGAPTKVLTAIAWLERGQFLRRDENATTVFQGRPLVQGLDEARTRIAALDLPPPKAAAWLALLARLIDAESDQGFSSDDLLGLPAVAAAIPTHDTTAAGRGLLRMLLEMQKARLLSSGVQMTAFVRHGVAAASTATLAAAVALERRLLELLREQEADPDLHSEYPLSLPAVTQALAIDDPTVTRERVQALLAGSADRAQHASDRAAGLRCRFVGRDQCLVQVRGSWQQIVDTAERRHAVATVCLRTLLDLLPQEGPRGGALLVAFGLEQLLAAVAADLVLRSRPAADPATEIEYALLFLHRLDAIVLHKGLAVFRQAMLLRVPKGDRPRPYTNADFAPLDQHQDERTVQIHVMHEFARRTVERPAAGLELLDDYFRLPQAEFLRRHFRHRRTELERATSAESWRRIIGSLTEAQRAVVEAGEHTSMSVLAGPGSGKTRVVVHRCAFLLRVVRVPAEAILVLCFNRSAALELRHRLRDLVGDDARGMLVQTYHGMAARLAGRSPADLLEAGHDQQTVFADVMRLAIERLQPTTASPLEAEPDDLRDRLLHGFRHILVDEYQDIDEQQYQLVSAIAGRTLRDPDRKLCVLAVGDDDQNVYQWRGSNVEFLRRFEQDYDARRLSLVENFRSTAHIIAAANQLIALNHDRLKADTPIAIDAARRTQPAGGDFAALDALAAGRVHVLGIASIVDQAAAVRHELQRLRRCDPGLDWQQCAVLAPRHALLDAVRAELEASGIPYRHRVDNQQAWSLYRLREVQRFLDRVDAEPAAELTAARLRELLDRLRGEQPREAAFELVEQVLESYRIEFGAGPQPRSALRQFAGELLSEQRRERTLGTGVMLGTVHGSKGAEYDHVLLLDGDWRPRGDGGLEERRRVYYVGMTRARRTLALLQCQSDGAPWLPMLQGPCVLRSRAAPSPAAAPAPRRYELLGLADLNLGFAGRDPEHASIHGAIERLVTGDALQLLANGRRWSLLDGNGMRVGALSEAGAAARAERLPQLRSVRVAAVLVRRRSDEGAEYRDSALREQWYVVIPELCWDGRG